MRPILRWSPLVALALLAACQSTKPPQQPTEQERAALRTANAGYDTLRTKLAQSVAYLGAPLRTLNPAQQASLAALLVLTRATAQAELLQAQPGGHALDAIWNELPAICPPIRTATFSRGGCLDESTAYASSMASCLKDGKKTEAQCEALASPELAAVVLCEMWALEALQGLIGRIPGRTWPTGPFPWEAPVLPGQPGGPR